MKFIQEINESRLYRRLSQLKSKSAGDIAERLFENLLAFQIISQENPQWAKRYAENIIKYSSFDGFRTSQSDLYNLITLILNQEKYSDVFESDDALIIPEMRLKRNLRNIARGDYQNLDYSELMMMLQRRFDHYLNGAHIQLRRQISDWSKLSDNEKKTIKRRMLIQMRERGIQSDLYLKLDTV